MSKMFSNPTGAYGYPEDGTTAGQVVLEFETSATVAVGQVLQLTAGGAVAPVDTAETDNIVGVALDAVTFDSNREQTVRVCVLGICEAQTDGGAETGIGVTLYADANARVTGAIATAADYSVGWTIDDINGSSAGNLRTIYVSPQRIA